MPIYEYQCNECGRRFEAIRPIAQADQPMECSNCGHTQTSRVLTTCFCRSSGETASARSGGGCAGCSGKSCSSCGH